jgi:hypothetical protein
LSSESKRGLWNDGEENSSNFCSQPWSLKIFEALSN